ILTGASNGAVRLLDARSGGVVQELGSSGGPVNQVGFSGDGQRFFAASATATKLWNGQNVRDLPGARLAAFSADGTRLAAAASDGVRVVDVKGGPDQVLQATGVTALTFG